MDSQRQGSPGAGAAWALESKSSLGTGLEAGPITACLTDTGPPPRRKLLPSQTRLALVLGARAWTRGKGMASVTSQEPFLVTPKHQNPKQPG